MIRPIYIIIGAAGIAFAILSEEFRRSGGEKQDSGKEDLVSEDQPD